MLIIKELRDKNGNLYLRRTVIQERADEESLSGRYGYSEGASPRGDSLIFLHEIVAPDPGVHLHTHPWCASVRVLSGWYEEVYVNQNKIKCHRVRTRFDPFEITPETCHRIVNVDTHGCTTLLYISRHIASWGFLVNGEIVPHDQYREGT